MLQSSLSARGGQRAPWRRAATGRHTAAHKPLLQQRSAAAPRPHAPHRRSTPRPAASGDSDGASSGLPETPRRNPGSGDSDSDEDEPLTDAEVVEAELLASTFFETFRALLGAGLVAGIGISWDRLSFDGVGGTALAFGLPPVLLGAFLLLVPWGQPPTSQQLLWMQAAANSAAASLGLSLPTKITQLAKPAPGSWREGLALLQAFFLEPWSPGVQPTPRLMALTAADRVASLAADELFFRGCLAAWLASLVQGWLTTSGGDPSSGGPAAALLWLRALAGSAGGGDAAAAAGAVAPAAAAAMWVVAGALVLASTPSYYTKARTAQRFVRESAVEVTALFQAFSNPDDWLVRIRRAVPLGAVPASRPAAFRLPEEDFGLESFSAGDGMGSGRAVEAWLAAAEQAAAADKDNGSSGDGATTAAAAGGGEASTSAAAAGGGSKGGVIEEQKKLQLPSVRELRDSVNSIFVLTTVKMPTPEELALMEGKMSVEAEGSDAAADKETGSEATAAATAAVTSESAAAAEKNGSSGLGRASSSSEASSAAATAAAADDTSSDFSESTIGGGGGRAGSGSLASVSSVAPPAAGSGKVGGRQAAVAEASPAAAGALVASAATAAAAPAADAEASSSSSSGSDGEEEDGPSTANVAKAFRRLITGPYGAVLRRSAVEDGVRATTVPSLVTAEDVLVSRIMIFYGALLDISAYGSFAASGGNLLASGATALLVAGGIAAVEATAQALMTARLKAAGRSFSQL